MPHPLDPMGPDGEPVPDETRSPLAALLRAASRAASAEPGPALLIELLDGLRERLGAARATLCHVHPDRQTVEEVAGAGVPRAGGAGPEERAVRRGRLVTEGGGDATMPPRAAQPLWSRGRLVGALGVERASGGAPFDPQDLAVLRFFADQLSLLLENRRLYEANQAKVEQLLALQRIGRQMSSTLEIDQLIQMVAEEALRVTGAEGGLLYLLEEGGDQLSLEARAGEGPAPGRESLPMGYGIPGWVARNGKPLRVSDRGTAGGTPAGYISRKSQLAVPLLSEGRVVGVLAVEGSREEGFTATHEETLAIYAAQAAKALEAARFFHQIRQERDLRDRILGGTPNGVVALDQERRIMLMNQAARGVLDVREEPEGKPVERYLTAPAFQERLRRVLGRQAVLESLEVVLGSGEQARHLLVSIFALGDAAERGATLLLQDLTERRKLDERVQRMARLASIGQLAAGVAHEIRNPLTGVGISLEILAEEEQLSDAGRILLGDINREVDRLEALIRGLLDFARPQPVEPRPMRLAKALEWHRTFQGQCQKKGVGFHLELRANPRVLGDPEKLKQLFLNLAINALDATPPGGEIRLWSEPVEGVANGDGGDWVRVAVADTGRGMDEATVAQIFNPFFTTRNEGTGLGLSIAHSIVEQHGGRIDVQSTPGAGSRFTVDLPALTGTEE